MSLKRISIFLKPTFVLLCLLAVIQTIKGFVNTPKIITKDGNLIFESGMNRNITFRLHGKSRITINDQYDLLDLVLLRKRLRNSTFSDTISSDTEWFDGDETNLRKIVNDVHSLNLRVFGPDGIDNRLRDLQNRTTSVRQTVRRYNSRLQRIETRVQTLYSRLELDSCKSNPCENGGTCFNLYDGFMCKCTKNFEGPTCDQDVNECALFAGTDLGCQNGGQCVNLYGGYSCLCTPGWFGIHCTQRKGDCMQSSAWELCGHGTCVAAAGNDNFGYKCICEAGWKTNGLTPACSIDVDECEESHPRCATKCINIPGSFTCSPCPVGLDGNGVNCRDIDECATNNGGCSLAPKVHCFNTYGSYHCGECPLGWIGDGRICTRTTNDNSNGNRIETCQNPNICYPGATCNEISNTVVCTCPPGMVGNGYGRSGCIQGTTKNCGSFPCLNGGTCVDAGDTYICICPAGFKLPNCTPLPNLCTSNPCHNHGRCQAIGTSFTCQCAPGFTGRLCDFPISRCGGVLAGLTGRLKYPTGPSLYDHNSQCAWLIRTNESMVVNVTFNAFELEDSTECRFDWLQLNDGRTAAAQVIGRFCGPNKPLGGNIISSTNYLYLWFRSDNSTSREGFDLEWNSILPQCGGIIEVESHGSIATPGSPGNYPRNRDCVWHLRAPNNKRIKLTFFAMQLEKHASCDFDFVEIKDAISDVLVEKFCNTSRPAPLLLPTNEAKIHFHSDNEGGDTGFQIYYSVEERLPGCGGTFTAKSGLIKSPIYVNEPISCEYDIKMSTSGSISIDFIKFNMSTDDCIEIYDVDRDKQIKELQIKYCGSYNFMPSTFHSLYNSVQIKYFAKSGEFELHYTTDCSYTLNAPNGTILSPDYPRLTRTEHTCTYKIITEPGNFISLHVLDFELRDSSLDDDDCSFTYLTINDGPDKSIMGPYCNTYEPPADPFISKSNMMILLFQSGSTSSGKGFKIKYDTIPMGQNDCGGVYTKPGYTIRLPSDDVGNYLHDLECYWVIMAPTGKGILINWKSFSLEATYDCTYDYVEIYDHLANDESAKPLGRYCDARKPPSFLSHSRLLTIKFVSDYSDSEAGFEMTYDFVDIRNKCGGEIFSSTGKIFSPGYPSNYSAEVDCTWIITVPHGSQLELQVVMFELEDPLQNTTQCLADWLEIRNGATANSSLIGKFCGRNIPSSIPSFTNQLRLTFHSDSFFNARGFEIAWLLYSSGCGGVLTADSGVITSPLYPQPYPNDASCQWRIRVHPGSSISITIEHLDMEDLFQCTYDYLEIIDGHSKNERPLVKLCQANSDEKQKFHTTGNEALIRFQTDSSNSGNGFLLSYEANCRQKITAMHGSIESPNYGLPYFYQPINCSWFISAPKGNFIAIEFTDFSNRDKGKMYLKEVSQNGTHIKEIKENESYETLTSNVEIIQNSTDVSFRLEYTMKGCIEILHRDTGEFESPNYPKAYPNDIECSWTIKVPFGRGIELTVEDIDIEDSVNCTKDGLHISNEEFSNHTKERHCGRHEVMKMTSSGHQLFIRFYSDAANNGKGFKASYKTIDTTCGGIFEGKNGVITSPNYPLNYPRDIYCEWKIKVSPHFRVKLSLDDLDIEDYYDCEMDYVSAYDTSPDEEDGEGNNKLFELCGNLNDHSTTIWTTSSNTAEINFKADDSNEQKGFKIHFEEICGERILITEYTVGDLKIAKHSQTNETCEWQIIAIDNTKRVMLTTTHIQLTPLMSMTYTNEEDCRENGAKIFDGSDNQSPIRSKFCKTHPEAIISNGHALTVSVPLNMIAEFEAEYMTFDFACGATYNAISGKFATPDYPSTYPVDFDCEWLINASAGNSLALTFEIMDIEQSDDCNNDYVEIREKDSMGRFLGLYCGTTLPAAIEGHNSLWIKFGSDDNEVVGKGFLASFNYVPHNEVSGESGIIESPRYPSKFHTDIPYSYRITVDKDYVVLLSIKHIVDVDMPFIKFYDGYSDIGAEIDYTETHFIRSHTNILYFTASRGPFQFEWEHLSKTEAYKNQTAEQNIETCGNRIVLVDSPVIFSSPGYPNGYRDNMDCTWFIMPKDATTHAILQFNKIDLEEFSDCFADYVAISACKGVDDCKQLEKLCTKDTLTVKSYDGTPYLKLDFHTDSSNNKTGFSSLLKTACGSVLSDRKGFVNLTNLATGSNYFQMDCLWTIQVRQGRRIRITFEESTFINPNDTTNACRSYFIIRNGIDNDSPFLGKGRYCENGINDILETTNNHAFVKFVRVGYPKFRASFRYEEIMHECSDNLQLLDNRKDYFTTITSPNYPNIANPHTECIWKITAPVHHIMAVHFIGKFDLTSDESDGGSIIEPCVHEYVQLNDGATELMPMLGRFCGTNKPATLHTTGNVLRLKYFTDVAEPKAGFMANITIASCGGFYYDSEGVVNIANNIVLHGEPEEAECIYAFVAPQDGVVRVDIEFELPDANNCSTVSHLELQEIDTYGDEENVTDSMLLCGSLNKRLLVETNKLLVILRLKDHYQIDDKSKIEYKMLGSRCGETIIAGIGVLQTPGYPNGIQRPIHCVWHLQVPKGQRIKIEFLDFDLGDKLITNSTLGQRHVFRGRLTFANDNNMQSIITRIMDNPQTNIYSTDNLMTIDAFLLAIGRHRGFKLRFSSNEYTENCDSSFGIDNEGNLQFRSNTTMDNYCNFHMLPSPKTTLVLIIQKYEQYIQTILTRFACEFFAPIKFKVNKKPLMNDLFCKNFTLPLTIRLPFPTMMELIGNKHNKLSLLDLNYKIYDCGGIMPTFPFYIGENVTITTPVMSKDLNGKILNCAWAIWSSQSTEIYDADSDTLQDIFQMEIALNTDFKGKCEDQYLLLYNGPNQESPEIGRYCGQSTLSHLVVQHGLFVEYFSANYETQSTFNITGKQGSGCGGKLQYPYRQISFDEEYYKNNVECIWYITMEPGFNLNIIFVDRFFIESSDGCKKDYLKIQQRQRVEDDWQDLKTLCGRQPPPAINTTGSEIRLIFRSDGDVVGDGFKLNFERSCGGILYATNERQQLISPGYPNEMPDSLYCNYTIITSNEIEHDILIRFDEFQMEPSPIAKCIFDNVTIIEFSNDNEPRETILCGYKANLEFHSRKRIEIIIRTDQTFPSKGFSLKYSNELCGGLITEASIIETPHHHADGNFPPNSKCMWNITAPLDHKILIKFEQLDYESQSECMFDFVEVYKGGIAVEDQRIGKFCGNMTGILPVLSISTNKAIIKSESDERDASKGFRALIDIIPNCDKVIYLGNSNASYDFTKFAGSYENNLDCSYVFKTEAGRQLQIEFTSFHVEKQTNCTADYLDVRDGAGPFADEIGRFCGHELPARLSTSRNALLMRFVSDSSTTSTGFSARITAIPTICGIHNLNLEDIKDLTFKAPTESNGKLAKNIYCFWKISGNSNIHLKFDKFDIGECGGNYLKIYNKDDAELVENGYGTSVIFNGHNKGMDYANFATEHVYCGNSIPDDYVSNSKEIYIKFKTDGNATGSGFTIEAKQTQGCYRNFTGTQGRIYIADTSDHCDIYLYSPVNHTISLYFTMLSFTEYDCDKEFIEVFDGHTNSSLRKLCSYVEPGKSLFSNTNELRLRIKMNTHYTEFDITYLASQNGPGCGGDFYNTAGLFTNPFYPDNVRNSSDCRWNVRVPSNLKVFLRFDVFDLGAKATCISDYLQIIERDENGEEKVMRQYCGGDHPKVYKSTQSLVTVRFHKTVNYDGTGWVIRFNGVYSNYQIPSYYLNDNRWD